MRKINHQMDVLMNPAGPDNAFGSAGIPESVDHLVKIAMERLRIMALMGST